MSSKATWLIISHGPKLFAVPQAGIGQHRRQKAGMGRAVGEQQCQLVLFGWQLVMGDFQGGVLNNGPLPGLRCKFCGILPRAYRPEEEDTGRETSEAAFHGTAPLPYLPLTTALRRS